MEKAPDDGGPLARPPVFVDGSGTRRRWFVLLGAGTSVLVVLAGALVATGFYGGGSGYLPGLPGLPRAAVVGASSPATSAAGRAPGRVRSAGPSAASASAAPSPTDAAAATPSAASPSAPASPAPPGHRNTAAPGQSKKK